MASSTPENKVKVAIRKWLAAQGIYYYSAAAGPFSVHGVPDIMCCARGRMVGIEVKAPGKEKNVTPNQQLHIKLINQAGGVAFVASSLDTVIDQFVAHELV